jgi:hypothetical protein
MSRSPRRNGSASRSKVAIPGEVDRDEINVRRGPEPRQLVPERVEPEPRLARVAARLVHHAPLGAGEMVVLRDAREVAAVFPGKGCATPRTRTSSTCATTIATSASGTRTTCQRSIWPKFMRSNRPEPGRVDGVLSVRRDPLGVEVSLRKVTGEALDDRGRERDDTCDPHEGASTAPRRHPELPPQVDDDERHEQLDAPKMQARHRVARHIGLQR